MTNKVGGGAHKDATNKVDSGAHKDVTDKFVWDSVPADVGLASAGQAVLLYVTVEG